ncbi:MAG TPA: hypothetical protein VFF13_05050 [archaeon]|nr:hypothetical protein [archaeon]
MPLPNILRRKFRKEGRVEIPLKKVPFLELLRDGMQSIKNRPVLTADAKRLRDRTTGFGFLPKYQSKTKDNTAGAIKLERHGTVEHFDIKGQRRITRSGKEFDRREGKRDKRANPVNRRNQTRRTVTDDDRALYPEKWK